MASPSERSERSERFTVTWWGVRGSTQVPGPSCLRFGGNTTCIEVRCDDETILIDAGTGIRAFGEQLHDVGDYSATLFFTHYHLDHVVGLPFFAPLFRPGTSLRILGDAAVGGGPRIALGGLVTAPYFPIEFNVLRCKLAFEHTSHELQTKLGSTVLRTCPLNHPGGATGIRIDHRHRSFVHLSDVEHTGPLPTESLVRFARGADALSYDAMFDEAIDYAAHVGWGHSTWQAGAALAVAAGVKRYVATHHAPEHDDTFLDGVCERLGKTLPNALIAWEGLELDLLTGALNAKRPPPNPLMAQLVATARVVE